MKSVKLVVAIVFILLFISKTPAYAGDVVINEIMYDLSGTDTNREWVEVYNKGSSTIDLASWRFQEGGTKHTLNTYQGGLLLNPNSYAVIVNNPTGFLGDHSGFSGIIIDSSFSLSNTGETLTMLLEDDLTTISDEVSYQNSWGGAGTGNSLERKNVNSSSSDSSNWQDSASVGGTPGTVNSAGATPTPIPTTTSTPTPTKTSTPVPTNTPTKVNTPTPTKIQATPKIEESQTAGETGLVLAENIASESPTPTPQIITAGFMETNLAKILIGLGGIFLISCGIVFAKWKKELSN